MRFYAIKKGRDAPVVVKTWDECHLKTNGFPNARFKAFNDLKSALSYLQLTDRETAVQIVRDLESEPQPTETTIIRQLKAYTDGSCTGQGTTRALAGAGIFFPELPLKMNIPVPGAQTSSRAELWAVIMAIEYASHLPGPPILLIHTDSKYVMGSLKNNRDKNLDLWEKFDEVAKLVKIELVKVAAHSDNTENDIADQLAGSVTHDWNFFK